MYLRDAACGDKPTNARIDFDASTDLLVGMVAQLAAIGHEAAREIVTALAGGGDPKAALRQASYEELLSLGLTEEQALCLLAAIYLGKCLYLPPTISRKTALDTPYEAAAFFYPELAFQSVEKAAVVVMNNKHHVLGMWVVSQGDVQETLLSPRLVFNHAIRLSGAAVIIAHNHPSGVVNPSEEDLELTKGLLAASNIVGIQLLDHLIIGNGTYRSIRESTGLWPSDWSAA